MSAVFSTDLLLELMVQLCRHEWIRFDEGLVERLLSSVPLPQEQVHQDALLVPLVCIDVDGVQIGGGQDALVLQGV